VKLEHARAARQLSSNDDEKAQQYHIQEGAAGDAEDSSSDEEEDEQAASARRDAKFGDDARNIQAYERSRARRAEFGVSEVIAR
jgi:hypothetical protein